MSAPITDASMVGIVSLSVSDSKACEGPTKCTFPTYAQVAQDAVNFMGLTYGGYVRDAVISGITSNDMDIWFDEHDDAYAFLKSIEKEYGAVVFDKTQVDSIYPIYRTSVNIIKHDVELEKNGDEEYLNIDIIVCDVFPVNDFNVNLLTWDGTNVDVIQPDLKRFDESGLIKTPPVFHKEDIINCIKNKVMLMLPTYGMSGTLNQGTIAHVRYDRIQAMERRGWIVVNDMLQSNDDAANRHRILLHSIDLDRQSMRVWSVAHSMWRRSLLERTRHSKPSLKRKHAVLGVSDDDDDGYEKVLVTNTGHVGSGHSGR